MINLKGSFPLNENGKDYFVGDIHGCYEQFVWKLKLIGFDKEVDRMFSVGDLIDRGPDSVSCLELLSEPWFFSVIGNHEKMMADPTDYRLWMSNGGTWAHSLSENELQERRELVENKMFQTIEVETPQGSIGVVHADSEDSWSQNCDTSINLNIWSRSKIQYGDQSDIEGIDMVVCGHTPLKEPRNLGNVLYIDTGAVFENDLTILSSEQVHDNIFL